MTYDTTIIYKVIYGKFFEKFSDFKTLFLILNTAHNITRPEYILNFILFCSIIHVKDI